MHNNNNTLYDKKEERTSSWRPVTFSEIMQLPYSTQCCIAFWALCSLGAVGFTSYALSTRLYDPLILALLWLGSFIPVAICMTCASCGVETLRIEHQGWMPSKKNGISGPCTR